MRKLETFLALRVCFFGAFFFFEEISYDAYMLLSFEDDLDVLFLLLATGVSWEILKCIEFNIGIS